MSDPLEKLKKRQTDRRVNIHTEPIYTFEVMNDLDFAIELAEEVKSSYEIALGTATEERDRLVRWQKDAADERIQLREQITKLMNMLDVANAERDDARSMADKLAEALRHLSPTDEPVNEEPGDGHDEEVNSYGRTKCGCSWDSGPYTTYCGKHCPFANGEEALESYDNRSWRPDTPTPDTLTK